MSTLRFTSMFGRSHSTRLLTSRSANAHNIPEPRPRTSRPRCLLSPAQRRSRSAISLTTATVAVGATRSRFRASSRVCEAAMCRVGCDTLVRGVVMLNRHAVIDADSHIHDFQLDWPSLLPPGLARSRATDLSTSRRAFRTSRLRAGCCQAASTISRELAEESTRDPKFWEPPRHGEFDAAARLPDMDEMGIDTCVLFGGHCFLVGVEGRSSEVANATLRAYNEYLGSVLRRRARSAEGRRDDRDAVAGCRGGRARSARCETLGLWPRCCRRITPTA